MGDQTDLTKEVPFPEGADKLKEYDFVRLISPDLNGIHLGKLVPTRHAHRILLNRCEIYGGILTMGPRFEIHMVPEILEKRHENGYLVPDMATCHPCPWASTEDNSLVCGIICEMNWQDGTVIQGHPRTVARRLLAELAEKHNLELFSGFEPEFRVFRSEGFQEACAFPTANRHQEHELNLFKPPKPYSNLFDMYRCAALSVYEPFLFDLDHKLKAAKVDIQDFMHEYGSSQLETPLMPKYGVQAADSYFIFKQAIRETAKLHSMAVSFMTKPLLNELANGCHYNHSLWDKTTGRNVLFDAQIISINSFASHLGAVRKLKRITGDIRKDGVYYRHKDLQHLLVESTSQLFEIPPSEFIRSLEFQDLESFPTDDDNLSSIAKHWIGGLIAHMPALTALCSPTVNCYRRFNGKFSPTNIDWDINDRFVALRVKNVDENRTYVENRICSSASCPYHVMAATIAAGMDGIERKLEPPERGKKTVADEERETNLPKLPTTLREALTALQADTVLTNRLGTQFVDWFIRTKQHGDLLTLSDVDVKEDSERMLAYERYEYLEFI